MVLICETDNLAWFWNERYWKICGVSGICIYEIKVLKNSAVCVFFKSKKKIKKNDIGIQAKAILNTKFWFRILHQPKCQYKLKKQQTKKKES